MQKTLLSATLAVFFTVNVHAAITFTPQENNKVGLYLGGQIWQSEASGVFGEKNTLIDFNLKKEQPINYFVAVVHPYPLLPNVRISNTTLDTTGKTNLTQEFSFGGENFLIGTDVNANFNVSYVDYTLYYQLFDNGLFSFDLGLTARDFNGAVTITGPTVIDYGDGNCDDPDPPPGITCPSPSSSITPTGKIKTDDIEPMLYVATNINIPLTRLSAFAQVDFSLVNDHLFYDYQIGLSYYLVHSRKMDFYLTLGYRNAKMEFEDLNDLYTDLEFEGVLVGVIAHF
jgi:hypothetical protein